MKLSQILLNESENKSDFYRKIINSVLNNAEFLDSNKKLLYSAHKNEIQKYIIEEFEKYNYSPEIYNKLCEVIFPLFALIEKRKMNLQKVKNFNDISFMEDFLRIKKKLSEIEHQTLTGDEPLND